MPSFSRFQATALIALQISSVVLADLYMHHPVGSNDRNRERNENRNNGNRLFNSQNNDKGGYPWPGDRELIGQWDGNSWYTNSNLRIEWTLQHAAGPESNADAQMLIQYACDSHPGRALSEFTTVDAKAADYLLLGGGQPRDGLPTGPLEEADNDNPGQYKKASFVSNGQNADGTNTIRCAASVGAEGCPGPNFGDNLDNDPALYNAFYQAKLDAPQTAVNGGGTDWKPIEFGYQESFYYYRDMCLNRYRNKGLYTADQQLNGQSARFTRQNPNGNRNGLECPEERDYYPWWNPSMWIDVAIFVSNENHCDYYQANSQNVASRSYCKANDPTVDELMPIVATGQDGCETADGTWVTMPSHGLSAPECKLHPVSRDNHLGNVQQLQEKGAGNGKFSYSVNGGVYARETTAQPETAYYNWNIPASLAGKQCTLRMRYNMSSSDYPQSNWQSLNLKDADKKTRSREQTFWDWNYNCPPNTDEKAIAGQVVNGLKSVCQNIINESSVPLFNRPYVEVAKDNGWNILAIAYNSHQVARTFQDRSYVFKVIPNTTGKSIKTLSLRGRRGNIVQCYPAVETDFVPHETFMSSDEALNVQFCGSDFNPNNNPNNGEGWQYSTRANMVNIPNKMRNMPAHIEQHPLFGDKTIAKQLAFMGVDNADGKCYNFQGDNSNSANNNITNCGKLNSAKACQSFLLTNLNNGKWEFVSTRNNNFSNRSHKGTITISPAKKTLSAAAIYGIAAAGIVVVAAGVVGGLFVYAKKHPSSRVARMFGKGNTQTGAFSSGTQL